MFVVLTEIGLRYIYIYTTILEHYLLQCCNYISFFENLWTQVGLYQRVTKVNEKLIIQDKKYREFINIAVHELRTPLQPIIGLSYLLRNERDNKNDRTIPPNAVAIVSITDTGRGIDLEILPRIFTKFTTNFKTGTGLGLFISKSIVEAHKGKIWAYNNKGGRGATFQFSLPLKIR